MEASEGAAKTGLDEGDSPGIAQRDSPLPTYVYPGIPSLVPSRRRAGPEEGSLTADSRVAVDRLLDGNIAGTSSRPEFVLPPGGEDPAWEGIRKAVEEGNWARAQGRGLKDSRCRCQTRDWGSQPGKTCALVPGHKPHWARLIPRGALRAHPGGRYLPQGDQALDRLCHPQACGQSTLGTMPGLTERWTRRCSASCASRPPRASVSLRGNRDGWENPGRPRSPGKGRSACDRSSRPCP